MVPLGFMADRALRAKQTDAATVVTDDFILWARKISQDFEETSDPGKLLRYRRWLKVDLYDRGEQLIYWDAQYEGYRILPNEDTDLHHTVNYFARIIDTLATEYSKSNPRLTTYSRAGDDQRIKDAVDTSQYVVDCLTESLWDKRSLQKEANLVLMRGGVFTRTYVDKLSGPELAVPQTGLSTVTVQPGQFSCPHCGVKGSLSWSPDAQETDEMPQPPQSCPSCGNGPIETPQQPILAKSLKVSTKTVRAGEIRSDSVDPYEVEIGDRCTGPWDSPFLRWDRVRYIYDICRDFPDWDPENRKRGASGINPDKENGLRYARQIEVAIGNTGVADQNNAMLQGATRFSAGAGAGALTDKVTALQSDIYFRYEVYKNKSFPVAVFLPGIDRAIPPETRFGDVFPHGMKVSMVDGECLAVEDICIDDEWDGYSVTVPTRGFFGNAAEQFIAIQDWINENVSLIITNALYASSGITIADLDRFEDLQAKPGTLAHVKDRGIGEPISNMIEHIAISGDVNAMVNALGMSKQDMVSVSGARDPNWGGEPGQQPGMQLATGINYNNAIASAVAGMKLELRADNRARRMEQALRWFEKTQTFPRYMQKLDDSKGQWLRGYQIGHDIKVKVEEDSHQPLTWLERRANLLAAMGAGYGKVNPETGKPLNPPWLERHLAKAFGAPEDPEASNEWATIAYRRIDAMMSAYQIGMKYVGAMRPEQNPQQFLKLLILRAGLEREDYPLNDPQAITPGAGDKNMQLIDAYEQFCATDEFRKAPLPVREAVETLLPLHFAADHKIEATKGMVVKQLMAPLNPPPPPPPPKESIALKDALAVPGAAEQMLAQVGINVPMGSAQPPDAQEEKPEPVAGGVPPGPPPGQGAPPQGGQPQPQAGQ